MTDDDLKTAYQARTGRPAGSRPPNPEQLARLLSHADGEEERLELLDRALADPGAARELELLRAIAVAGQAEESPTASRWPIPLALAASLLLAVAAYYVLRGGAPDDTLRAPPASGAPVPVSPGEAARVPGGAITFIWHPAPPATAYRLELLTEAGSVAATARTSDTVTTVSVTSGGPYRWVVVGLLPDGGEAPSRPRRIHIAP